MHFDAVLFDFGETLLGRGDGVAALIDSARQRGVDVTAGGAEPVPTPPVAASARASAGADNRAAVTRMAVVVRRRMAGRLRG